MTEKTAVSVVVGSDESTIENGVIIEADTIDDNGLPMEQKTEPGQPHYFLVHHPDATIDDISTTWGRVEKQGTVRREAVESFLLTSENQEVTLAKEPASVPVIKFTGRSDALAVAGRVISGRADAIYPLRFSVKYAYLSTRYKYVPPDDLDAIETEMEWPIDIIISTT